MVDVLPGWMPSSLHVAHAYATSELHAVNAIVMPLRALNSFAGVALNLTTFELVVQSTRGGRYMLTAKVDAPGVSQWYIETRVGTADWAKFNNKNMTNGQVYMTSLVCRRPVQFGSVQHRNNEHR
jgi:hypothetical protein